MTLTKTTSTDTARPRRPRVSVTTALCAVAGIAAAAFVLLHAQHGTLSPTTGNPAGRHEPPPVTPLLSGFDVVTFGQVMAIILFAATVGGVVLGWRRRPKHPVLLMVIASNTLCWFDPINNWAIGLVYNPRMWHFPQSWPWVRMSPIVEPLTSFVYAPYVLLPCLLSLPTLRWMQKTRRRSSFVWTHPLACLAAITFAYGFVWDAAQEILLVRTQFLTYTRVVPFGSIFVGKNYQFPLLMASGLITITMIPAAVLLYRDDTGRTQAEKLARRLTMYALRPALATFLVMTVILNTAFVCFGTSFWLARVTGAASSVACPWPYPEAKISDPDGRAQAQGAPGPFTVGSGGSWLALQPHGRPRSIAVKSDRCATSETKA